MTALLFYSLALVVVRFPTLNDGVAAATAIVRSGISIARCEFLDAQCIRNLNAYDKMSMPEEPTLFFEFHGSPKGVIEDANAVKELIEDFNGSAFEWTSEESERRKLWQARHNAHWAAVAAHPGMRTVSTDMAVPLSKLSAAVAMTQETLARHRFPFSILGHVADGNYHCQIITDPANPTERDEIREIVHAITMEIIAMGGTCTGEHGIGAGKIEALEAEIGTEGVAVMRAIKKSLDPHWILNPGKIFLA